MTSLAIDSGSFSGRSLPARVSWVDAIKGICIVSVVAMWVSDHYLELASGWLHEYVIFAKPFRMPDFFLVSGLFLDKVIDRPWKQYVDRKVVHYLYFVLLWSFFTLLLMDWIFARPDFLAAVGQYAHFVAQPNTSLWFITMLPIYFLVTRLIKDLPRVLVLAVALALFLFRLKTGIRLIDNFGIYYIFFLFGYYFSRQIFATADWIFYRPVAAAALLLLWFGANIWVTKLYWLSWEEHRIMLFALGIAGILGLIALSQFISRMPFLSWISYLGSNSIVVYLGFYIPMLFTGFFARRVHVDLKTNGMSIAVWLFCVASPVALHFFVRGTRFDFLFVRPRFLRFS